MKKRTFNIGPHIWFVLHYGENGKMTGLEEHDMREGGSIGKYAGMTWEQSFVEAAVERASGDDYQQVVRKFAEEFLKSDLVEIDIQKK